MSQISLHTAVSSAATMINNTFIDKYMPEANGEFVKVYLCLLRILGDSKIQLSLESMADHLHCTEGDILRALKYWAGQKLLSLEYSAENELSGITLLSEASSMETTAASSEKKVTAAEEEKEETEYTLTPSRIKELKQNEEISQLLYMVEQYFGKPLTPTETRKILYFYDGLKMPAELIEYLVEYCIGKNHKNIRYIETVALGWAEEGIKTVAEAKKSSSRYHKDYFTILKFLGITNRNPIETEIRFMDTWIKTYGFSMEIIQEACSRTVLQTGQASFQYTDRILKGWNQKQVHVLEDIKAIDTEHKKSRTGASKPRQTTNKGNRFNNFEQRSYDFKEYEKRLLNQ